MQKQAICIISSLFLSLAAQLTVARADAGRAEPLGLRDDHRRRGRQGDLAKADDFLSSAQTMVGDFEQKGQDGRVSQGKVYIQKPGKLRFEYAAPAALEVIADGSNVAVTDRRLKTTNSYPIGQTPLKFLLQDKIDLKSDTQILNVLKTPDAIMILLDDRTTFGGTSRIRLIFDKDSYELRAWQVRDPQGYETLVTLYNIDLSMKPDPKLFKISSLDQSKN